LVRDRRRDLPQLLLDLRSFLDRSLRDVAEDLRTDYPRIQKIEQGKFPGARVRAHLLHYYGAALATLDVSEIARLAGQYATHDRHHLTEAVQAALHDGAPASVAKKPRPVRRPRSTKPPTKKPIPKRNAAPTSPPPAPACAVSGASCREQGKRPRQRLAAPRGLDHEEINNGRSPA